MTMQAMNFSTSAWNAGNLASSSPSVQRSRGAFLAPDARLASEARNGNARALALEAARTLVSEAFVKPILSGLHEGSMASDAFKPGTGEKRFRPLLDAALADRIVEGSDFAIVRTVADRFERSIARNQQQVAVGGLP
jgi:hypothetical protein